jgi:prepilin-type processing-associated H-X9-DG protein
MLSYNRGRERKRIMSENKGKIRLTDVLAIVAAVVLVLIIVIPLISNARAKSSKSTCQMNMLKIATAIQAYSRDYNGHVPPVTSDPGTSYMAGYVKARGKSNLSPWTGRLMKYVQGQDASVFRCPLVTDEMVTSGSFYVPKPDEGPLTTYGMNWRFSNGGALGGEPDHPKPGYEGLIQTLEAPPIPSQTVLIIETQNSLTHTSGSSRAPHSRRGGNIAPFKDTGTYFWAIRWFKRGDFIPYGHDGGCNVILADGHADFIKSPPPPYPPKASRIEQEGLAWW